MNYRDCLNQCSNARILECCEDDNRARDNDNCGCNQRQRGYAQQRGCGCNNAYDRDVTDFDDDREYKVPRSCR